MKLGVRTMERRKDGNKLEKIYLLTASIFFFILFFRAFLIADAVGACEY
jgi:hypothetical protein